MKCEVVKSSAFASWWRGLPEKLQARRAQRVVQFPTTLHLCTTNSEYRPSAKPHALGAGATATNAATTPLHGAMW